MEYLLQGTSVSPFSETNPTDPIEGGGCSGFVRPCTQAPPPPPSCHDLVGCDRIDGVW